MKGATCILVTLLCLYKVHGACMNGGTEDGDTCICPHGYSGNECELELAPIIDCSVEDICKNEQTCATDEDRGDYCQCGEGYTGRQCEYNDNESCTEKPCLHEGECDDSGDTWTCNCKAGFTGRYCEHYDEFDCIGECENDGMCIKPNPGYSHCKCKEGFKGKTCDEECETEDGECSGASTVSWTAAVLLLSLLLSW